MVTDEERGDEDPVEVAAGEDSVAGGGEAGGGELGAESASTSSTAADTTGISMYCEDTQVQLATKDSAT